MPRFRFRLFGPLVVLLAVGALLGLVVFPLAVGPLVRSGWIPPEWQGWLVPVESLQTTSMVLFVCLWFFFLGGCFASFLNVVAWRVPRGRTINGSSHCPHCGIRLSMRDNLPVIGWLRNQGRCRNCRTPISPRYLIVELILGGVTLGLVALEVFAGGANLPGLPKVPFRIIEHVVIEPGQRWFQLVGWHLALIYSLFTLAVIRSERLKVPASVVGVSLLVLVGVLAVWPELQLVDWQGGLTWQRPSSAGSVAMTAVAGTLAGLVVGSLLDRMPGFAAIPKYDAAEVDTPPSGLNEFPPGAAIEPIGEEGPQPHAGGNAPAVSEEDSDPQAFDPMEATVTRHERLDPEASRTEDGDAAMEVAPQKMAAACERTHLEPVSDIPASSAPSPVRPVRSVPEGPAAMALVGLVLGWQAALGIGLGVALTGQSLAGCQGCRDKATLSLLATIWATAWICGWRWIWAAVGFAWGGI